MKSVREILKSPQINGDGLNVRRLLSGVMLSNTLDLSEMRVTRVRALRDDIFYNLFRDIDEEFQKDVFPRLGGKGILINGSFSYCDKNGGGISVSSPLAMIVDPEILGVNRTHYIKRPHYVRFNTEFCEAVPPKVNYTGLDDLFEKYVVSIDPDFKGQK